MNYTCSCNETSCGAGKTCVGGTCYNCEKGEKCDCSGNQVSDGNGGCYTPNDSCNPNPCPSETPSCSALDETQYSCSCTSDSCPDGKECSDMACQNCSAGDDCGCSDYGKEADGNGGCRCPGMKIDDGKGGCRCPDDYESDGTWGGCKLIDPCMNVSCPDAQKCVEGDCVNCPLGEDCGCFEDDAFSNGDGICEPNVHECDPGKAYNTETRACEDCAENDDCGCFEEGGYADGKGGCKIICKDWEYWDGSQCVPAVGACNTSDDCVSGNYCLDHSCRPGCESDDDCTDGYCENNKCTSTCRNDDDCQLPDKCYEKKCQTPCDYLKPCTNPKYPTCTNNYYTSYKGDYFCNCTSTSCGSGYTCGGSITWESADAGACMKTGGTCTKDTDCAGSEYCLSGKCTPVTCDGKCTDPKYPKCLVGSVHEAYCYCTDTSCGNGYFCDTSQCKPIGSCKSDSDCDSYENCYDGVCKKPCDDNPCTDPKYPTCSNVWVGGDHYYEYVCQCTSTSCGNLLTYKCETTSSGVSYDTNTPDSRLCKVQTTEQCTTDDDCSAEKKCFGNYCIFRNICTKDADCASNERCSENGYCVISSGLEALQPLEPCSASNGWKGACPDGYVCSGTAKACCPSNFPNCDRKVVDDGSGWSCQKARYINGQWVFSNC